MRRPAIDLFFTLLVIAVTASVNAGDLKAVAEHSGGASNRVTWRIRIANGRVNVFASAASRNATFEMTDEQRDHLIALLDETRFSALRPQYGMGGIELKSCSMTISWGARKNAVTLLTYSQRKPPSEAESLEVQRAYRVWDALKALGRLADLPDDCREELDIWEIPPK